MKVFVWGSYNYANFGDDIMAIMLGDWLKSRGHEVGVFRLTETVSNRHQLRSFDVCETAVRWADLVLLGGGAVFGEMVGSSDVRSAYDDDIGDLVAALHHHKKQAVGVSLGVGATSQRVRWTANQEKLLNSPHFVEGSVRLKRDEEWLQGYGTFKYIPDIVFSCCSVNMRPMSVSPRFVWNVPRFTSEGGLERVVTSCVSKFAGGESHLQSVYGRGLPPSANSHISRELLSLSPDRFESPFDLIQQYSNSPAVVISTKLHLGIALLATGCIFISVGGKPKTSGALIEYGLTELLCSKTQFPIRLLRLCSNSYRQKLATLVRRVVPSLRVAAEDHFALLHRHLEA